MIHSLFLVENHTKNYDIPFLIIFIVEHKDFNWSLTTDLSPRTSFASFRIVFSLQFIETYTHLKGLNISPIADHQPP